MTKSRKNNLIKTINKTANQTLPVIDKGLKTIGTTSKDIAKASIPIIEKGVSAVYGTMATGVDLGVKGIKSVKKSLKSRSRKTSYRRNIKSSQKKTTRRRRQRKRQ